MIRDHFRVLKVDLATGRGPVKIPERFKQVVTWKGPMDTNYLDSFA